MELQTIGKFEFQNGLINKISAEATQETQKEFVDVIEPLLAWAKVERYELLLEMMPEGIFVYNAKNAKKTLVLLQEWKERTQ